MKEKMGFSEMFIQLKPNERKVVSQSIFTILAGKFGKQKAWRIMRHELGINRSWLPVLDGPAQDLSGTPEQKQRVYSYNVVVSVNLV